MKSNFGRLKLYLAFIFIYVLFAELILPVNKFIPKISILFDSIISLVHNYGLFENSISSLILLLFVFTFSFVVFSLFALFANKFFFMLLQKNISKQSKLLFGFILLSIILFAELHTIFIIFILLSVFVFVLLSNNFIAYLQTGEYQAPTMLAKKLGKKSNEINKIIYLQFLPNLKEEFNNLFYFSAILLLISEFIADTFGLGSVVAHLLLNNDQAGLFAVIILIWFLFELLFSLLAFLLKRIIFWDE